MRVFMGVWRVGAAAAVLWVSAAVLASAGPAEDIAATRSNAIVNAVERAGPTVVNIRVKRIETVRNPFFDMFLRSYYQSSLGSGVIINGREGYILTNAHVVSDAVEIEVTLQDGRAFRGAELIGADAVSDLAVLKIEAGDLPEAILGDSDALKIGEWAIAIGNPFGSLVQDLKPTVTVGVVSASNRVVELEEGRPYYHLIQTDASVNPGNSGGPLLNAAGEVIGINTFIFSSDRGSQGVNFAIAVNVAKKVIRALIENGRVNPPWTGAEYTNITPAASDLISSESSRGAAVAYVHGGSPAEKAGLKRGDVILGVNGQRIFTRKGAEAVLRLVEPFEEARVVYERAGESREAFLTPQKEPPAFLFYGAEIRYSERAEFFGDRPVEGLIVENVERDSPFYGHLQKGDVLQQMAVITIGPRGNEVFEIEASPRALERLRAVSGRIDFGEWVAMRVLRGEERVTFRTRI